MGSCSRTQLYQNFLACHQKHFASGTLAPCSGQEQLRLGKDFLDSVPAPCQRFQRLDFYRLARDYVAGQAGGQQPLPALGKAFELLELISLNLYLWPWRKEIKSIKTFTGAFVYFIQPVFPPDVLQGILEKMGYTRKGTSDYVMSKQVSKEEIGQLGFEFFLARAECELMQETLDRAKQSGCQDIVQVRSSHSYNQADCIKYLKGKEAGPRGMAEEVALDNEGDSKPGLRSEENLAKSGLPGGAPLPLTDVNQEENLGFRVEAPDGEFDATSDPLSASMRLPLDSLDLYREYTDITISANIRYPETQKQVEAVTPDGKQEQCDYPLIIDKSLMQKAQTEALVKLSPGQTGPLSLSLFSDSTPIATSSESKDLKSKERSPFDTIDPKCSVRHSVLDATSQIYPDDKRSSKTSQKLDGTSSAKYGSFRSDAASRKRDYVEIELKKIDKEKLPYPIAETAGPAPYLQANHFQTLETQRVELRHPEPTGVKPHGQTQTLRQVPACQTPNVPECCVCAPTELLGVRPLLDDSEFVGNPPQDMEDQIVREPPQSFYIPPNSLEGLPSSACDNCGSPICSSCNSRHSVGHGQVMSRDCLQIQELMVGGGTDPYLYVTKLTDKNVSLDDDKSMRCNRCNKEEDI